MVLKGGSRAGSRVYSSFEEVDRVGSHIPWDEYVGAVDPEPFQRMALKARSHVDDPGVDGVCVAADLHRFMRDKVTPDESVSPGFNRGPRKTLDRGGNCVDHSILFASLLLATGFRCRLTVVSKSLEEGHMFVRVLFNGSKDCIKSDLKSYYKRRGEGFWFMSVDCEGDSGRGVWVVADPMGAGNFGDYRGLMRMGYLGESVETGELAFSSGFQFVDLKPEK